MLLEHSACPTKRDIHAPKFRLAETQARSLGRVDVYECEACGTRVATRQLETSDELFKAWARDVDRATEEFRRRVDQAGPELERIGNGISRLCRKLPSLMART